LTLTSNLFPYTTLFRSLSISHRIGWRTDVSAQDLVARAQRWSKEQPWQLFGSQILILVRNEVRRNLFTRRRIWIYLLALIPVLIDRKSTRLNSSHQIIS